MNIVLNALGICLIIFCASKAQAMNNYRVLMDEQDRPITGPPQRYEEVYIANLYDDYSHIHPLRCKKDCKGCANQQAEQTKVFARKQNRRK